MKPFAIVTDSTANLSAELVEQYDIPVIPLNVHWGDTSYLDGVTLDADTFYRWLSERKDMPTTSQPSAGAFIEFFRSVAERYDTDAILAIHISSDMSGTLASAIQAKAELTDLRIELVDSRSVSLGLGLQVLAAVKSAREGRSLDEVKAEAEARVGRMRVAFAVDTLEFLHRGGRIGGASRLLGSALNLKPVLTIRDGRVEALEKVRSRRKSLARVVEIAKEWAEGKQPKAMAVLHANAQEDADWLMEALRQELNPAEMYQAILTPVVGTHGGPGTTGVAFYTE